MTGLSALLAARAGFEVPPTHELFQWPCLVDLKVGGLNMCINKVVILEFDVAALVAILFIVGFRKPRIVPRGLQNLMEAVYGFVGRDIVDDVIGPKGARWHPYLMVLFLFAFLASLMEVLPGVQFPVSSRIAIPLVLAIGSWLIYNYAGVREHGLGGYLKAAMFPPGVPKAMYILVTPIELLTVLVLRPFTLALRLFANFFAGHLLLVVFFLGTAYLVGRPLTIAFAVPALVLSVLLVGLEIFIALVQAYVFTLLTAVYVTLSVSHEH